MKAEARADGKTPIVFDEKDHLGQQVRKGLCHFPAPLQGWPMGSANPGFRFASPLGYDTAPPAGADSVFDPHVSKYVVQGSQRHAAVRLRGSTHDASLFPRTRGQKKAAGLGKTTAQPYGTPPIGQAKEASGRACVVVDRGAPQGHRKRAPAKRNYKLLKRRAPRPVLSRNDSTPCRSRDGPGGGGLG